jgi:hypothetical protein
MKTLEGPQIGAHGEIVASRNHYGQHLRKKGHPKKLLTVARLQSDTAMRIVAEAWNSLTDEQRERWYMAGPYVKRFGVPPVGKRVFVRVRQQTNGWRGEPWEASAVVPPSECGSGSRNEQRARATNRGV